MEKAISFLNAEFVPLVGKTAVIDGIKGIFQIGCYLHTDVDGTQEDPLDAWWEVGFGPLCASSYTIVDQSMVDRAHDWGCPMPVGK